MKVFKKINQEKAGYVVGYCLLGFVVDKSLKVTALRYGFKKLSQIANKTKISPTREEIFERAVDSVLQVH